MLAITGAAGFIGSSLLASFQDTSREPIAAFDIVDTEEKRANVAKRKDVNWVDPKETVNFLKRNREPIEAVIHLGAETSTAVTNRSAVFATNVDLSKTLWSWCTDQRIPFIYASSASVYGTGDLGFDDSLNVDSVAALQPLNLYGESKRVFDAFVAEQCAQGKQTPPHWAGLRFFNVYGPNEIHKEKQASVVSQMYPVAARGEPYALFRSHRSDVADGKQKRDFVYVDDCISVVRWLLGANHVSGFFNVGTGQARTFLDLAKAVYDAVDKPFEISWRDTPDHLRAHYQYFTQADLTRLRAAGYRDTFTSLEDGVTLTIQKYLSQPDPYR